MKLIFILMILFGFTFNTCASTHLPQEITDYKDKRDGCEHWRGEPIPDGPEGKPRAEEIDRNIKNLCTGMDKQLADFKSKYKDNKDVMSLLSEYEEIIEN